MKAVEFDGMSVTLQRPPGWAKDQCNPLPILRLNGTCVSCWRPTWRERFKIFFSGRIWLGIVSGVTQPPVYVSADQPFKIRRPEASPVAF